MRIGIFGSHPQLPTKEIKRRTSPFTRMMHDLIYYDAKLAPFLGVLGIRCSLYLGIQLYASFLREPNTDSHFGVS